MIRAATVLACLALAFAGTAAAAEGPVDSSPVPTSDPTTGDAIEAYLRDLPPVTSSGFDGYADYVPYADRRTYREVGVAVGTGGYRSVYGRQVSPLGKDGTLDIAVQHTRFGGRYGRGSATGLSVALDFTKRDRCNRADDRPWRRHGAANACLPPGGIIPDELDR